MVRVGGLESKESLSPKDKRMSDASSYSSRRSSVGPGGIRRSTTRNLLPDDAPAYQVYMRLRYPRLCEFVVGNGFESVMGVFIMYNCLTIGVDVHLCPPPDSSRDVENCPKSFLMASENVCTFIFVAEFMLRGFVCSFNYHFQSWDRICDTMLVWVTGVLLTWIVGPAMEGGGPSGMRMLTALRAFRLLRVARVIRFNFKEMWLMLRGLAGSAKALGSMVLVFVFVFYLFGILAVTLIADNSKFSEGDDQARTVHEFFNGLDKSMWTLLQIMTADSWSSQIARPAINVQPSMWMFFTAYILIAMMVLLNLVTAIIVENAMNQSKEDQESLLLEMEKKKEREFKHLKKMFEAIDADGSGELDAEEFSNALEEQPEIIDQFKLLGFGEQDTRNLFQDLDNGDGSLTLEEFIGGVQGMQGNARSADLIRTQKAVQRLSKLIGRMSKRLGIKEKHDDDEDSETESKLVGSWGRTGSKDRGMSEDPSEGVYPVVTNLPNQVPEPDHEDMIHHPKPKRSRTHSASSDDELARIAEVELAKEQLAASAEMKMSLEARFNDIQQDLDSKLTKIQSVVQETNRANKEEMQQNLKEFLADVSLNMKEFQSRCALTCRKEIKEQLEIQEIKVNRSFEHPQQPVNLPRGVHSAPISPDGGSQMRLPSPPKLPKKKETFTRGRIAKSDEEFEE